MVHVVVDCQPRYLPHGPVLEEIGKALVNARQQGELIVILEFFWGGETYADILDAVSGYNRAKRQKKRTFGGGEEVIEICRANGWDMSQFRLCGAETYCCVAETAEGLIKSLPNSLLYVLEKACFDKCIGGPFPRHKNIRWI